MSAYPHPIDLDRVEREYGPEMRELCRQNMGQTIVELECRASVELAAIHYYGDLFTRGFEEKYGPPCRRRGFRWREWCRAR